MHETCYFLFLLPLFRKFYVLFSTSSFSQILCSLFSTSSFFKLYALFFYFLFFANSMFFFSTFSFSQIPYLYSSSKLSAIPSAMALAVSSNIVSNNWLSASELINPTSTKTAGICVEFNTISLGLSSTPKLI